MSGGVLLHFNAALQQIILTFLLYAQTTSRGMDNILKAKLFSQLSKRHSKTPVIRFLETICNDLRFVKPWIYLYTESEEAIMVTGFTAYKRRSSNEL